jgi:hypothetical protein
MESGAGTYMDDDGVHWDLILLPRHSDIEFPESVATVFVFSP